MVLRIAKGFLISSRDFYGESKGELKIGGLLEANKNIHWLKLERCEKSCKFDAGIDYLCGKLTNNE